MPLESISSDKIHSTNPLKTLIADIDGYDKKIIPLDITSKAQQHQKNKSSDSIPLITKTPTAQPKTDIALSAAVYHARQKALKENEAVTSDSALQSIDASIQQSKGSHHPHLKPLKKITDLLRSCSHHQIYSKEVQKKLGILSATYVDKNCPQINKNCPQKKYFDGKIKIETPDATIITTFRGSWSHWSQTEIRLKKENVSYYKPYYNEFYMGNNYFIPVDDEIRSKFFSTHSQQLLTEKYTQFKHPDTNETFNITASELEYCLDNQRLLLNKYLLVREDNFYKCIYKHQYNKDIHYLVTFKDIQNYPKFNPGFKRKTIDKKIQALSSGKVRMFKTREGNILSKILRFAASALTIGAGGLFIGAAGFFVLAIYTMGHSTPITVTTTVAASVAAHQFFEIIGIIVLGAMALSLALLALGCILWLLYGISLLIMNTNKYI